MIHDLMYIELKTGYSDGGPAWIGYVKTSKSKKTIYFNLKNINLKLLSKSFETSNCSYFCLAQSPILSVL